MFGGVTDAIVDKLKPYLTTVFRNFDADNFSFSFGGSATLEKLQFRPTLLQDLGLDLPFQATVLGGIGKIYVSIGFSGLTVTVDDVYILISSLRRLTYDEKKEAELEITRKRNELIETIKKLAEAGKKKEDDEPGWIMRKLMSLVQGAKVIFENIHIRFEEDSTAHALDQQSAKQSYSSGIKLKSFTVETMDEIPDWSHGVESSDKTFFKKGDLKGLSLYWNANSKQQFAKTYDPSSETTKESSIKGIEVKMKDYLQVEDSKNITYVVKPIVASVKAMITKHPEKLDEPFSLPKAHIDFQMNAIQLEVNDYQYEEVLSLKDFVDQLSLGRKYLKLRPNVPISKGNTKKWWKMAYSTAAGDVERRRKNWSWEHIKQHRELRDKYAKAYLRKVTEDKPSDELKKEVQALEDSLDNFNIILVQRETEEKNALRKDLIKKRQEEESAKSSGFFSYFSSAPEVKVSQEEIDKYIHENYSADDKKKIYNLIDIEESKGGGSGEEIKYPRDYNEIVFGLKLKGVEIQLTKLKNEVEPLNILDLKLNGFHVSAETHPGVAGLKIVASMKNIDVTGVVNEYLKAPAQIFQSIFVTEKGKVKESESANVQFLKFTFETHPLTSKSDTKITFESQQSQLIYDYKTIQKLMEFVTPPPHKIQHVGGSGMMSAFNKVSADGLKNMSQTSQTLEVDIKIMAPTLLIPEDGIYTKNSDVLIFNLGTLTLKSSPREKSDSSALANIGEASDEINPKVLASMFNHFEIQLNNFEILLALKGEDVDKILYEKGFSSRPKPITNADKITVNIYQCIVTEDVRFPKLKVGASVPEIYLDLVDVTFLRLAHLGLTLPLPGGAKSKEVEEEQLVINVTQDPNNNYKDAIQNVSKLEINVPTDKDSSAEKAVQYTDLILDVNFEGVKLSLAVQDEAQNKPVPFLQYELNQVQLGVKLKTFGMSIDAGISSMNAIYMGAVVPGIDGPIYLLNTPVTSKDSSFIKCHLFSITSACPKDLAGSIKQKIELDISSVDVILHQDAIQSIMSIVFRLKNEVEQKMKQDPALTPSQETQDDKSSEGIKPVQGGSEKQQKSQLDKFRNITSKFQDNVNDVLLKATASLSRCSIKFTSSVQQITQFSILNWMIDFEDKPKEMKISTQVNNLEILNLQVDTLYPNILTIEGNSKLIDGEVIMHKNSKTSTSAISPEIEVQLKVGGPKLVVVGSYVKNVLKFVKNFQTALNAVGNFSKDAGSGAVALGENLYQNDMKLLLNFSIESPSVIIPRSDTSLKVMYYYFGHVTLKNELKEGEKVDGSKVVVLDNMNLNVHGVQLSRAILDSKTKVPTVESILLEPVKIEINVSRNLSKSWYNKIPLAKINADLLNLIITGSDNDLIFVLKCYNDLLNNVTAKDAVDQVDSSNVTPVITDSSELKPVSSLRSEQPKEEVQLVDFAVKVERVGVAVYKGELHLVGKTGIVKRDASQAVGGIFMDHLTASGDYWKNNNLSIKLGLKDILIQDERPGASILKDLIVSNDGVENNSASDQQLMELSFKLGSLPDNSNKVYTVNFKSRSFKWIFNMDFINEMAKFGVSILDRLPKFGDSSNEATGDEEQDVTIPIPDTTVSTPSDVPIENVEKKSSAIPLINADINLNEITVIVLENPNSIETNAILLNLSGKVNLDAINGGTKGFAELQLSAFTSKFELNESSKRVAEILRPTSLRVDIILEPNVQTVIELVLSDVIVHYSAGTLHLMYKIITEFTASIKSRQKEVKTLEDNSQVWNSKSLTESKFWFLKPESSFLPPRGLSASALPPVEKVTLNTGKIFLTIESGVGAMTTPLLFLDITIDADVSDWTSQLHIVGHLELTCGYSNPYVGAMEYIIEPVATVRSTHVPWELKLDIKKNKETATESEKFVINVVAEKSLELMVSKAALEIISAVVESFTAASSVQNDDSSIDSFNDAVSEKQLESAPYIFKNTSGSDLILNIDQSSLLYLVNGEIVSGDIQVGDGQFIPLGLKSGLNEDSKTNQRQIRITIPKYNFQSNVLVHRGQSRYFDLAMRSPTGMPYGLIVDIEVAHDYATHITVHTIVQVINELELPIDVLSLTGPNQYQKQLVFIAKIPPKETISLPFSAIYDQAMGVQFKPQGYGVCPTVFNWQQIQNPSAQQDLALEGSSPREVAGANGTFNFSMIGSSYAAVDKNSEQNISGKNFTIRLRAPLAIRNLLPVELSIVSTNSFRQPEASLVKPGREEFVTRIQSAQRNAKLYHLTLVIPSYQGKSWTSQLGLNDDPKAPSSITIPFKSSDQRATLFFKLERTIVDKIIKISVYCPYWILNHTLLDLTYKNKGGWVKLSDPVEEDGACMFPTDLDVANAGEPKTTLCAQVGNGEWSTGLNIDAVALGVPTGLIFRSGTGAQIELCVGIEIAPNNHLTKIVTLSPRYTITNKCSFPILFYDQSTGDKLQVESNTVVPYWAKNKSESILATFNVPGTSEFTPAVALNQTNQYFLKLNNKYGGLCFNVNSSDNRISIVLDEFVANEIPLLFVNDLQHVQFEIFEEGSPNKSILEPKSSLLRAWESPAKGLNNRNIYWNVMQPNGVKNFVDITKTSSGGFQALSPINQLQQYTYYTFNVGLRKILLFTTTDSEFPILQRQKNLFDNSSAMEVNLSLANIGLSVVDNIKGKDILYGRISSAGQAQLSYKAYPLGFEADLKLRSLRLDNQDNEATYPIILDKKKANANAQPLSTNFLAIKIKQMKATAKSPINFINGDVALQGFEIGADMGLLGDILELAKKSKEAETRFVDKSKSGLSVDKSSVLPSTNEFYSSQLKSTKVESSILIFEDFGISDISFNVSFSMAGADKMSNTLTDSGMINYLIKTLGSLSIGIKDGHFNLEKIQYHQHRSTTAEIMSSLKAYYVEQVTKEAYKNIFNLDMPGSPFNALKGVGSGVTSLLSSTASGVSEGRPLTGAVKGATNLIGFGLGGITSAAGGLLGGVGKVSDTLHVPLLGGIFGGLSSGLNKTSQAITKSVDTRDHVGGEASDRMRQSREVKLGVPLQPLSASGAPPAPVISPAPGSAPASGIPPPPPQFGANQPPPAPGSPTLGLLQKTAQYQGAGIYISEISFGPQAVILTQNKIFHLQMASPVQIHSIGVFEWRTVENITTDGQATLFIGTTFADQYGRINRSRFPINTGSPQACQALIAQIQQVRR